MSGPLPPPPTPPGSDDPTPEDALRRRWEEAVVGAGSSRASGTGGQGGEACPSPEALLDAIEAGHLHPEAPLDEARARILNHLARCDRCREEARIVGALLGSAREEAGEERPRQGGGAADAGPGEGGGKGATGRKPPGARGGASPSRWNLFPLAAAATLLLVVGGGSVLWWSGGAGDGVVRGGEGDAAFIPTLACSEAGFVEATWPAVEGARGYRVELFDGEGAVLAEGDVVPSHLEEGEVDAPPAPILALRFDPSRAREAREDVRLLVEARLPGGVLRVASPLPLPDSCFREGAP